MKTLPSLWLALLLPAVPAATSGAPILCVEPTVQTLLAVDSAADRSLFALSDSGSTLVVLDHQEGTATAFPDRLAGRRTGGSHGPGPFLVAGRCGPGCLQPFRWRDGAWERLGQSVDARDDATIHFAYSADGTPWMLHHRLVAAERVTRVEAWRWSGASWNARGALHVRAIGSPGALPDPADRTAVLVGTGRFSAERMPEYWIPTLPAPSGSPGGQIVAAEGGAAYLTFDSRLYVTTDGGAGWYPVRWTPWAPAPRGVELWRAGSDYWLDLPAAASTGSLPVLWYDERRAAAPAVHLTRWRGVDGWAVHRSVTLAGADAISIDQALTTRGGDWLLLGACRATDSGPVVDGLLVPASDGAARRLEMPLRDPGGRR